MDHLQAMRVFVTVVEQGSFTRASERLNMSGAATTRHVSDLEGFLGTRLLNRTTRRLSLTEAGRQYLERVQQILEDVDEANAHVTASAKKPHGTLHIYSHLTFGQTQLAGLLHRYAQQYPDVQLDVRFSDRTVDLVDEGFDIGFFISPQQKFNANMVARQLAVSDVVLCASPAYVARHGRPSKPEDLAEHACLNFSYEHFRHGWDIEGPQGRVAVPIKCAMVSNNAELLRQAAVDGMGIVMRASYSLGDDLATGRLVHLLPGHRIEQVAVSLVYPSRRFVAGKLRSFIDFITAEFPDPEADPWLARHQAGISALDSGGLRDGADDSEPRRRARRAITATR